MPEIYSQQLFAFSPSLVRCIKALFALPSIVWCHIKIFARQNMAMNTVCFFSINSGDTIASPHIFLHSDGFKMMGINASSVAAHVVNHKSDRYIPTIKFIRKTMSQFRQAFIGTTRFESKISIPCFFRNFPIPFPTTRWSQCVVSREIFYWCMPPSAHNIVPPFLNRMINIITIALYVKHYYQRSEV